MNVQSARNRLKEVYLVAGIALHDDCIDMIVCAHLGITRRELSEDQKQSALPFLIRWTADLSGSVPNYDFGRLAGVCPSRKGGLLEVPNLSSLLALMAKSNQTVQPCLAELEGMQETSAALLWHLKAIKGQTDHTLDLLSERIQADSRLPSKVLGR